MLAPLWSLLKRRHSSKHSGRAIAFEALEHRDMPALVIDVGHHFVEPLSGGGRVNIQVRDTDASSGPRAGGFLLKAQLGSAGVGPVFRGIDLSGGMWSALPHVASSGVLSTDRQLAQGQVSFAQGLEAEANGVVVSLDIDTTGIPYGSFELRLAGTRIGSSQFVSGEGEVIPAVVVNGTLQVRSVWQNPDNIHDVNGDGYISPIDLLLIVNELNRRGSGPLPIPSPGNEPPPYFDVDGNGERNPLDALVLINCLNNSNQCTTTPPPITATGKPDVEEEDDTDAVGAEDPPPDTPDDSGQPDDPLEPEPEEDYDDDGQLPDPLAPYDYDIQEYAADMESDLVAKAMLDDLLDLGLDWDLFAKAKRVI